MVSLAFVCFILISVVLRFLTAERVELQVDGGSLSADTQLFNQQALVGSLSSISVSSEKEEPTFDAINVALHRNGEPEPCATVSLSKVSMLRRQRTFVDSDDFQLNKFQVEAFFTTLLVDYLPVESCRSTDNQTAPLGMLGYCDMGPLRTVIQKDHANLVRVPNGSLPCRFFTKGGLRITSLDQLADLAKGANEEQGESGYGTDEHNNHLHLYAVPAGRMFMFTPSRIGETIEINHVVDSMNRPIKLTVLSLEPRLFDIHNFFSEEESEMLIHKAVADTSPTHGFHRSTTGTGQVHVFNKRTSENAWDTDGPTALVIKKRCFSLLGIDEYQEELSDGLQVLRYNLTNAYINHMDYLDDPSGTQVYDYDSAGKGGNRFATILLYMSDLGEKDGGETVFPKAWPVDVAVEERVPLEEAINQLRLSGSVVTQGSWEEEMAATCRTRLTVRPKKGRAVLFYSQFPNGMPDNNSLHGGCPVLNGTKYAANLWTWSGIRPEYDGAPRKRDYSEAEILAKNPKQLQAQFRNSNQDPQFDSKTELYYGESGLFGKLGPSDPPIRVNTYEGHVWNIKVNGKILQSFIIQPNVENQEFVI